MNREQHSADWSSYIERANDGWWVVVDKEPRGCFPTREEARVSIRIAKVMKALKDLGGYALLSKLDFDRICARHNVDPEADALVDRLVLLGWQFNPFDDQYISPSEPDPPEGRWGVIMDDDWLPDDEEGPSAGESARARVRAQFQVREPPLVPFEDFVAPDE